MNFNSIEDLYESSNALQFLSRQSIHIRHNGTTSQITLYPFLGPPPFQQANTSITLEGITQATPNKQNTKDHN
jgi:hypothetical protein